MVPANLGILLKISLIIQIQTEKILDFRKNLICSSNSLILVWVLLGDWNHRNFAEIVVEFVASLLKLMEESDQPVGGSFRVFLIFL